MRNYKSQIPEKAAGHFKQNQSVTSVSGAFAQESTSNVMKYHKKTILIIYFWQINIFQ